jgi:hypothetical protein
VLDDEDGSQEELVGPQSPGTQAWQQGLRGRSGQELELLCLY